jgi:hypothetical protein
MRFLTRRMALASCPQPFLKGSKAFARLLAGQQAFDADILIQIDPMDTLTLRNQTPVVSFRSGTI